LLIPYLEPGGYFGIEPNRWLVDEAIRRELGQALLDRKLPQFLHVDDFALSRFGVEFDYVLAQSIFSHTYPDMLSTALRATARVLAPSGLLVATYVVGQGNEQGSGWRYPECVTYTWQQICQECERSGLSARWVDWPHPRQHWFVAARSDGKVQLDKLAMQFIASPKSATRAE
jgi:hypothetical protein